MKTQMDLSHIDFTQIPPIQQKRIVAFVNHFVTTTVNFVNNFAQSCESRFMDFEYKTQKIEASLLILEAQLASIPGFDGGEKAVIEEEVKVEKVTEEVVAESPQEPPDTQPQPQGTKASEHPIYARFFKMLRVGVHELAVKQKMQSEGLNPEILDKPDALLNEDT